MVVNGSRGTDSASVIRSNFFSLSSPLDTFRNRQTQYFHEYMRSEREVTLFIGQNGGWAYDLKIRFKLLIVFNTLLYSVKHLNYLLEALTLCLKHVSVFDSPGDKMLLMLDIELNGHFHLNPFRTLCIYLF